MSVPSPLVERKIIGVMMIAARERAHRTTKQVAQRLGVSTGRMRQYETGVREISLPELELLSLYLQVPLSYFLNFEAKVEEELPPPLQPEKMIKLRALLGERIKNVRSAAGKTRDECAEFLGIKPSTLARYERGLGDIPITELQRLAKFVGVNLFYFIVEQKDEQSDLLDLEKLARLPKDVRGFALDSQNLPYLRMAQKFSDLPTSKLKELGEILLIVR